MPLSVSYINEVLWSMPSTVVVDSSDWSTLMKAFKMEGRSEQECVVGRMHLRHADGGYAGLMYQMLDMQHQLEQLHTELARVRCQWDELKASSAVNAAT